MSQNEQGRLLRDAGEIAEAAMLFTKAFSILADLWKKNYRIPFMECDMAAALNARGGVRLALQSANPDPKALDLARADCVKARSNLDQLIHNWPDYYVYQGLQGQALANLGRISLAQNDPKQALELMELSLDRHQRALKANPESPDDKALEAIVREELKSLKLRLEADEPTP